MNDQPNYPTAEMFGSSVQSSQWFQLFEVCNQPLPLGVSFILISQRGPGCRGKALRYCFDWPSRFCQPLAALLRYKTRQLLFSPSQHFAERRSSSGTSVTGFTSSGPALRLGLGLGRRGLYLGLGWLGLKGSLWHVFSCCFCFGLFLFGGLPSTFCSARLVPFRSSSDL